MLLFTTRRLLKSFHLRESSKHTNKETKASNEENKDNKVGHRIINPLLQHCLQQHSLYDYVSIIASVKFYVNNYVSVNNDFLYR